MEEPVHSERGNFYDGGVPASGDEPAVPPDRGSDVVIVLDRRVDPDDGEERFVLLRRIAYDDRRFGQLLVPVVLEEFHTDLTSVPAVFTWLVPKTGAHLPAALLHDGMVMGPDEEASFAAPDWSGPPIDRVDADRVFRDAMADTGTGVVRRWLVWSAVATATMVLGRGTRWSTAQRWWYRVVAVGTLLATGVLGVLATLDLLDVGGAPRLAWMGERPLGVEVLGGLAGAVVFPALFGLLWGRFRVAGWVMGIGLAVLLHVTAGVLVVSALYWLAEWAAGRAPRLLLGLAAAASTTAAVVFAALAL